MTSKKISQCVILAAGKGTRICPLTLTKPKALLRVGGKTILEHNLNQLQGLVKEVVLVIGYKGEAVEKYIGRSYKKMKVSYVWQKDVSGTGDAARKALKFLDDRFLLLYGDDLYQKKDIENSLKKFPCILLAKTDRPSSFGQVLVKKGLVKELKEKPKKAVSNLVNSGLYFLDKDILNIKIKKSERGEYEFTDFIREFIKKEKLYYNLANNWFPLSYVWNLLEANEFLIKSQKTKSVFRR